MSELHKLRQAWGAALGVCEFFGWDPEDLQSGLTPHRDGFMHPAGSERGRLERLAVELANSLRERLHNAEENEFWKRGNE